MKKNKLLIAFLYLFLFVIGTRTLWHGFPDIERFFPEWMDERLTLTHIMKFGSLDFSPKDIFHPPLYHYLTFVPISLFFLIGKLIGIFSDKIDFARFYFNNTHYFFLIARSVSYIFYWLAALVIFKILRLFYSKVVSHIVALSFLLIPRFIADYSTIKPETLLFFITSGFFYFFLKYYMHEEKTEYLFISAFILGLATAAKYNALFLGFIYIMLMLSKILKNKSVNYRYITSQIFGIAFFVFLGFFIGNPFFILKFKTYFYNFYIFATVHTRYYNKGYWPAVFGITHLKYLCSTLYLNIFGFLIFTMGILNLFKKERKLFILLFSTILLFEIYFGLYQKDCSPLYFLNPLFPFVALIFGGGVGAIIKNKRYLWVLIMFFLTVTFNYYIFWRDLSQRPTHLQKARLFIEENMPEFTNICIGTNNNLPQLNMTRQSYKHLIQTAPTRVIEGHERNYRKMDDDSKYDSIFKELRIQSLAKKPQYNLIRWPSDIKDEARARDFFKKNNIEYILSSGKFSFGGKDVEEMLIASLVKNFEPNNVRVYEEAGLYLYKVNLNN